jgi:hypothetical protein
MYADILLISRKEKGESSSLRKATIAKHLRSGAYFSDEAR